MAKGVGRTASGVRPPPIVILRGSIEPGASGDEERRCPYCLSVTRDHQASKMIGEQGAPAKYAGQGASSASLLISHAQTAREKWSQGETLSPGSSISTTCEISFSPQNPGLDVWKLCLRNEDVRRYPSGPWRGEDRGQMLHNPRRRNVSLKTVGPDRRIEWKR